MMPLKVRMDSVTDREKWAARGASLVAKLKATKVIWFPPDPVDEGKKTGRAAKRTATRAASRSTGAAKKTTKRAAKKSTATPRKTAASKKS